MQREFELKEKYLKMIHPMELVKKNIKNLPESDKRKKVILLCTGSFNPPQRMHINLFELAKRGLEKKGFVVVGGFISATHGNYVKTKYLGITKTNYISCMDRLKLLELSVKDSGFDDYLSIDSWEGTQRVFFDFDQVATIFSGFITKNFEKEIDNVFYLCGSDYFNGYEPFWVKNEKKLGVCYLERENRPFKKGYKETKKMCLLKLNDFKKEDLNGIKGDFDLSSTKLRKFLCACNDWKDKDKIKVLTENFMYKSAAEYLVKVLKYSPKKERSWNVSELDEIKKKYQTLLK